MTAKISCNKKVQAKSLITLLLLGILIFCGCREIKQSDQKTDSATVARVQSQSGTFFRKNDLMLIGAYYYPEQWPHDQWERDFRNMASFGFEFTHMAEFSWALLEPKEGTFDFTWLDEAISLASKEGLKIVLCTPSLCPPAWMGAKYPEIYLVDPMGIRKEHGLRANASLTNPVYRRFVDRIVTEMAKHYAKDKRITGWQLDNEPAAMPDFSTSARKAFQTWLENKYLSIDKLNEAWGGSFWSTRYDSFDQVLIPNEVANNEDKLSPHSLLDFKRFTADVSAAFLNNQALILRKNILPEQWITTNYTNVSLQADPRRSDLLDFPCFTMYPLNGKNFLGGENFRKGVPWKIYEACDYYRPIKGVTGIMELQPGQVNWAPINPHPAPGTIHMWLMQAFGGRCSFVCTYRYRHPLFSSEMYHDAIVGTDGVTLTQGGEEFVQAIKEIGALRHNYDSTLSMPGEFVARRTAILWSHDVMWDLDIQPQTTRWNTWQFRNNYTAAVKSMAAPMDFISERDDFSGYPFLIAPAYQLIDDELVKKWKQYAENGGNLILTCRTGYKNKDGHFFESSWAGPINDLIGASIDFFDMLPENLDGGVSINGRKFIWNVWSEILSPSSGTEVLASYSDQYYSGKPAVVSRKTGKGSVTFIGFASSEGRAEREIIREVYKRADVQIEELPQGVFLEWRDGFYVAVNYTDSPYKFRIPEASRIFTGTNPLQPAEALVWKQEK